MRQRLTVNSIVVGLIQISTQRIIMLKLFYTDRESVSLNSAIQHVKPRFYRERSGLIKDYIELARGNYILVFPQIKSRAERTKRAAKVKMTSLSSREWSEIITKYETICCWKCKLIFRNESVLPKHFFFAERSPSIRLSALIWCSLSYFV